jgi:predicted transcriptional regulator
MKTYKTRHQFYLADDLSARLDALAAKPGASKTAILTDALNAWLERKAGNELDARFGPRLDRQTRASERIEQKVEFVAEALGVFVQHQLTLTAHTPLFEAETAALGRQRYQKFLDLVGKRIAGGKPVHAVAIPKQKGASDE